MNEPRHYKKAPILEALIDVQVVLPEHIGIDQLVPLIYQAQNDYPKLHHNMVGHVSFNSTSMASTTEAEHTGYRFERQDERQSFTAKLDGFAFSRLRPYDRWESFREEAQRLWKLYSSVASPQVVTRIAVRYINRIDIPLPFEDFGQFLLTLPDVSKKLPQQGLSSFLMQLQIPQPDIGAMLIINEGLVPPTGGDTQDTSTVAVVLDIDLFQEGAVEPSEDTLWEHLEVLHTRKNEVFEACITDRTRELIS